MNKENTDTQTVAYTWGFEFEGKIYGFKNKNLFLLSSSAPQYVEQKINHNQMGYYLNRKFVSFETIKPLVKQINIIVDISGLQWYIQEDLKTGIYINR